MRLAESKITDCTSKVLMKQEKWENLEKKFGVLQHYLYFWEIFKIEQRTLAKSG